MPNNIKSHIDRLNDLVERLQEKAHKLQFDFNNGKATAEVVELIDASIKLKHLVQDLEHLNLSIDLHQEEIRKGILDKDIIEERLKPRLERELVALEKKLKRALRVEKQAKIVNSSIKLEKATASEEEKKKEEKPKEKPEEKKKPEPPPEKKPIPKPPPETKKEVKFTDIQKRTDEAVDKFNKVIPGIQKEIFAGIQDEIKRLDTYNGNIKTTVANIKIITSIKNKLLRLILTPEYKKEVKDFVKAFNEVTTLQNQYWQSVEKEFKPRALLKEIKTQAIADTVKSLTASGIGSTIQEQISDILRTNITTGGSYADLNDQLRKSILGDPKTDGSLLKYSKQITTDSINQYSAQYTQVVSNDLGFEWFAYQGSDILTTRPFCDAMTDFRYFHITEIPRLLAAKDLYYMKDGVKTKVPIYEKTKLPHGMIPGTNPANFQINRGGYNCGHQIRPVSAPLVPADIKERVFATAAYKRFKTT